MVIITIPKIILTSDTMLAYRPSTPIPLLQRSTIASRMRNKEKLEERIKQEEKKLQKNKTVCRKTCGTMLTPPQRSKFEPDLQAPSRKKKIEKKQIALDRFKINHQRVTWTDEMFLNYYQPSQR